MKNIWRLFVYDFKHLWSNTVTAIIILGLILLPSIFSWYNIIGCWDVFNNTGNLKVAVANSDEGYESDLVPLKVNIGEQVVSTLRGNDQLDWVFTDEQTAIEKTESGEYYAAVVIPKSFSKDMMTYLSDDIEHAQIVYYTNEKLSAVAPKVTDKGADQVAYQINEAFSKTISELALTIASSFSEYAKDADANSQIATLATRLNTTADQLRQSASVITLYNGVIDQTITLLNNSSDLLAEAEIAADKAGTKAAASQSSVAELSESMEISAQALKDLVDVIVNGYDNDLREKIDNAFNADITAADDASAQLAEASDAVAKRAETTADIIEILDYLIENTQGQDINATLVEVRNTAQSTYDYQVALARDLKNASDRIAAGSASAKEEYEQISANLDATSVKLHQLSTDIETKWIPGIEKTSQDISTILTEIETNSQKISAASRNLQGEAGSACTSLTAAKGNLSTLAGELNQSANELNSLSDSLMAVLNGEASQTLDEVLGSNPESLASAFAAPVKLQRNAVFPAQSFGAQMAPLYTTLALWIGALLLTVAIRIKVPTRVKEEVLDNPKYYQLFLGRFGIFAFISLCQSTTLAVGNMLFLEMEVFSPLLYLICFWVGGLVFAFFMYAMVASFANLGKAIGVLFLIIQVTSGGGSFPLQVLPDMFQYISPYLPATHLINAMRASMMGVWDYDFWLEILRLLAFLIPAALIGLVLSRPLAKFLDWYIEKTEESQLIL